ncbi:MAG TPA: hypothetical protein VFP23_05050 [Solirubrobacterales bacterium]|nr:hypothetical protein [Solirubrobacterales bacterium]
MATENPTDCAERDPLTPAAQDAKTERLVLAFLIAEHPAQVTIAELSLALNDGEDFARRDAIERAVRELVGTGLLHRKGAFVLPTRAALYFARLVED